METVTVKLSKEHDKKHFSCGEASLDNYFKNHVTQDRKRDITACYVMQVDKSLIGYYTLSCNSIAADTMPEELLNKLPKYTEFPTVLIGRLAVDVKHHKKGYGELLLIDALRRAEHIAEHIGAHAVVVDAISEDAMVFYEKYGFQQFPSGQRMMMAMQTVRKQFCKEEL